MSRPATKRIVGIHGVRNYRPATTAQDMADRWARYLGSSYLKPVSIQVTYWAPLLRGGARQGRSSAGLAGEEIEAFADWANTILAADERVAQGRSTAWLRNVLSRIATRFQLDLPMVEAFVKAFFPEVVHYLSGGGREAVQDLHMEVLQAHRPDVVLAHSLGTVITYETLWRLVDEDPTFQVPLLVTYGSPLGLSPWVEDHLEVSPSCAIPGRPPNVERWVNIADVGDLIAIPRRLGSKFTNVEDFDTTIARWDFHKVENYLADPLNGTILE